MSTTVQNFIQIGIGVSVLRMRDFAPLKGLGYFFWFLRKTTAETRAPILTQNTSNGSAQGSAFWGSQNQNLRFRLPLSQKTAIFGPENVFNIGRLERKRPLIVVVAQ